MKRRWYPYLLMIPILIACLGTVGAVVLEGRNVVTHKERVGDKGYGVMLHVDLDAANKWVAKQTKAGLQQYATIRIEVKLDDEWRVKEYQTDEFVRLLGLRSEHCCKELKEEGRRPAWKCCPFCRKGF